jgi:hypothetical protein
VRPQQFEALVSWVGQRDCFHAPTSSWNVGQQIEHCCLVIGGVHEALAKSQPPAPRARISLVRRGVFLTGRIPRGRAKAPKSVHPAAVPDRAHLETCLERAREQVEAIRALGADAWFKHFVFDVLRRDEALRFLQIHTDHHLRIMRQIASRG